MASEVAGSSKQEDKREGISYETFKELWIQSPHERESLAKGCYPWNTFKKYRKITVDQAIELMKIDSMGACVGLVPSIKALEWVQGIFQKNGMSSLDSLGSSMPIEDAWNLHLRVFVALSKTNRLENCMARPVRPDKK